MKFLVVLLLVSCSKPNTPKIETVVPKYKVGDCVTSTFEYVNNSDSEFLPPEKEVITIQNQIVKIGKKNYLVNIGAGIFREKAIKDVDTDYNSMNCSDMELL